MGDLVVDGQRIAFQLAEDFAAPTWPSGERPQQLLALGATTHEVQPGDAGGDPFRVYLDPAGHPFCLCWD